MPSPSPAGTWTWTWSAASPSSSSDASAPCTARVSRASDRRRASRRTELRTAAASIEARPYRFARPHAGKVRRMDTWNLRNLDVEPRQPSVLRSDRGAARCIVINLPAGEQLQDHEVHEHAWLHVHEGEVEVVADGETRTVQAGAVVHWRPQERHGVRATQDALLLLLLAPWPGRGHPSTPES